MSEASAERDLLITNIPLWLMEEYLRRTGAAQRGEEWEHPAGWRAHLSPAPDYQIGSLRVGRLRLRLSGDPAAIAQAEQSLQVYLLRGGG
jgi:hypothetical protein